MIVVDTQALLWWLHEPGRLGKDALAAFRKAEKGDGFSVSVISIWEIAVKTSMGMLSLPLEIGEWFRQARSYPGFILETLTAEDAISSTQLPGEFHKDPVDRIIVALARRHGIPLVTSDKLIQKYQHVETIW